MVAARELTKKFEEFCRGTIGEIQEYFQKHQSQFATPLRYRVQVIMLPADGEGQKTCGELQEALAKGADFGELARKHSQGPNQDKGGDLGWLETMAPALKEVVERLEERGIRIRRTDEEGTITYARRRPWKI